MSHPFLTDLAERIAARREAGLGRTMLPVSTWRGRTVDMDGREYLNFSSNDFLGLAQHPEACQRLASLAKLGCGAGASRLVTGTSRATLAAEQALARHFGYESCLILGSGFVANLTLLGTLFHARHTLLLDKRCHSSSMAGALHSRAAVHTFRHNSMRHLEKLAKQHPPTAVVTESLFSMDADTPDLTRLAQLKQDLTFLSIVDEAHAYGVLGAAGRGLAHGTADVAVGTLGKAFGMFGAFVLGPQVVCDALVHFGQGFIYTTALPPWHGDLVLTMLELVRGADQRRAWLTDLSRLARQELQDGGFSLRGEHHILAVDAGDEQRSLALSKSLRQQGIIVFAARYPTVPLGQAILRICLTATHTMHDIRQLVAALHQAREDLS